MSKSKIDNSQSEPVQHSTSEDGSKGNVTGDTASLAAFDADDVEVSDTSELVNRQVETFVSPSNFVPNADWINMHIVAKGKGTKRVLGRIMGVCHKTETQTNMVKGQPVESIKMTGEFEAFIDDTGEVIETSAAFLPRAWAEKIRFALTEAQKSDPTATARMLISLGIEATGNTIPYRWTIATHMPPVQSPAMAEMKRMVERAERSQLTLNYAKRIERIRAEHAEFDTDEKLATHRVDPNAHAAD